MGINAHKSGRLMREFKALPGGQVPWRDTVTSTSWSFPSSGPRGASWSDRVRHATKKEQRLLILSKRMELTDAIQKKLQYERRRSCTEDETRRINKLVDQMIAEEVPQHTSLPVGQAIGSPAETLDVSGRVGKQSALRQSLVLNRVGGGRLSIPAITRSRTIARHFQELPESRPSTVDSVVRPNPGNRRKPARERPASAPITAEVENVPCGMLMATTQAKQQQTRPGAASSASRPWAQGPRVDARRAMRTCGKQWQEDSLVRGLRSQLSLCGVTPSKLQQAVAKRGAGAKSPSGRDHVFLSELVLILRVFGMQLTKQQETYLRKKFGAGAASNPQNPLLDLAMVDVSRFARHFLGN